MRCVPANLFVLYKKTDDEKYKAKSIVLPRG